MTGRGLKIALAASLAGNLFLIGLIAGARVLGEDRKATAPPPRPERVAAVAERLDPADAEALKELMRREGEEARPRVVALRAARREIELALGRPNYDPQAVRSALARAREEEAALRSELDTALLTFAAGLEPEERAAIAPLLRKGGRGGRGDRPREEPAGERRGPGEPGGREVR